MKRYFMSVDEDDFVDPEECPEGCWVRYDDAMVEVAEEKKLKIYWHAMTDAANAEIDALKAEIAAMKEWRYSDQDLAIKILSYLGFSQEPSKEPYADRRRDRIAEMICLHCESLRAEVAALKAPSKPLKAEEVTEVGWYWARFGSSWDQIVEFYPPSGIEFPDHGEFIGPIKMPEV